MGSLTGSVPPDRRSPGFLTPSSPDQLPELFFFLFLFSSLLSGRISTLKDDEGAVSVPGLGFWSSRLPLRHAAIFIDRDPSLFAPILNFLRSKELYPRSINVHMLMHEAEFYGITPLGESSSHVWLKYSHPSLGLR
ncbi:hypothetical protein CCH79_00018367 [Gambusia affinis]|uniref:Potassium channel tetramerisation-type BTB domain-containing protein n=1 Tax=Gambusia affinis TaxID=33528 RepID=A0A315VJM5_GAMAF|nr:hypothetical protein CCH79_00018367 [Gambusia affinis]